jgi:hypothetical protein
MYMTYNEGSPDFFSPGGVTLKNFEILGGVRKLIGFEDNILQSP